MIMMGTVVVSVLETYFEGASVNIGGFLSLFDGKLGSWILI